MYRMFSHKIQLKLIQNDRHTDMTNTFESFPYEILQIYSMFGLGLTYIWVTVGEFVKS